VLNEWFVNDFTDMEIGAGRHGIMVTRKGNVIEHGMILRFAETAFGAYAFQPYLNFIVENGRYDVELIASPLKDSPVHDFIYQLAGPRSLELVEQAARRDLHDLGFTRFTDAKIAGHDVRVIRMGMGGTLSYEVHGHSLPAMMFTTHFLKSVPPMELRKWAGGRICAPYREWVSATRQSFSISIRR
jgi:glycine cleavage system aminomethyltransferase T